MEFITAAVWQTNFPLGINKVLSHLSSSRQSRSDRPSSQDAGTSLGDDDHRWKIYQAEPETTCTAGGLDCEQEVSLECSHHCTEGEKFMYSSVKHKGWCDL